MSESTLIKAFADAKPLILEMLDIQTRMNDLMGMQASIEDVAAGEFATFTMKYSAVNATKQYHDAIPLFSFKFTRKTDGKWIVDRIVHDDSMRRATRIADDF